MRPNRSHHVLIPALRSSAGQVPRDRQKDALPEEHSAGAPEKRREALPMNRLESTCHVLGAHARLALRRTAQRVAERSGGVSVRRARTSSAGSE